MTMRSVRPFACLLLAGCYAYYPPTGGTTPVGQPVQLTLTDSGAVVLATRLGPAIEAITGTLVGDSAGVYTISMRGTRQRGGEETEWKGERVTVARSLAVGVEVRRFSPGRTALAAVTSTAAMAGAYAAFRGLGMAGAPGPTPGGTVTGK